MNVVSAISQPTRNAVMFATATYQASDPDEYVSLIRGARIEVIASQRGTFNAEVTRVNLGDLWMQNGGENLARTFRGTTPTDRVILHFRRSPGSPVITLSAPVAYGEIALISPGQMGSWRSSDPCEWSSMSLPTDAFLRYGAVLAGRDLLPQDVQQMLRPSPTCFRRLCRLQNHIVDLAERAPWLLRQPNVARGLQQHLIEVAFAAIGETFDQRSLQDRHHQRVMARFEALIEANPDRALYLTEVCEAAGVTERTFRNYCQRDFGMKSWPLPSAPPDASSSVSATGGG